MTPIEPAYAYFEQVKAHGFVGIVDDLVPEQPLAIQAFDLAPRAHAGFIAAHAGLRHGHEAGRLFGFLRS